MPGAALIYANDAFTRLTGYASDEALDRNCRFLHGPETSPVLSRKLGRAIAAGEQIEVEIINYRKDGTKFLNRLTLAPIRDESEMLTAYIGLQSDITFEAQRRDASEQQREKMAALGRAMGGVAHEINNMLQPVSLLVQDAMDHHLISPDGAAHLAIVLDCTRNARNIIGDVLAFSRPASRSGGEVREVPRLFEDGLPLAIQGMAKDVILSVNVECPPFLIEISQTKFSQILVNLVSNAVAAMGGIGQLNIQLDQSSIPSSTGARKAARLRITDTGCGMDATTQERAFEPFFTTKPIGQGTGLGLPLVYALVQETGGSIKLESAPGQGTAITILIPAAKEI